MKVYVVYDEYPYEGCSEPMAVFTTDSQAEEYIVKNNIHMGCWKELEVEDAE